MTSIAFKMYNKRNGQTHTIELSQHDLLPLVDEALQEKLADIICHCEPLGETNVVDCDCGDYIDEFAVNESEIRQPPELLAMLEALQSAESALVLEGHHQSAALFTIRKALMAQANRHINPS